MSGVHCQVSGVRYHISHVMCRMSPVPCHMSLTPTAISRDPPYANSPTMYSRMVCKAQKYVCCGPILDHFGSKIPNDLDQRVFVNGSDKTWIFLTVQHLHFFTDISTYRLNLPSGRFSEKLSDLSWGKIWWEEVSWADV